MAANFLDNDKVNYKNYDSIIDTILQKAATKLQWNNKLTATKYRVSDGKHIKTSNSSDASNFHRDVNIIENNSTPEIYTLVIYLNHAVLEIIPNSCNLFDSEKLNKPKAIHLSPGDAILFNACMLHRGKFTNTNKSRRCIQIFEIYKNEKDYEKYHNKILTIPDTKQPVMEFLSQRWNYIPFINTYIKNIGIETFIKKIPTIEKYAKYKYISPESQRPRAIKSIDKGNLWRLLINTNDSTMPNKDYNSYILKPLMYTVIKDILVLLTVILLILTPIFFYKNLSLLTTIIPFTIVCIIILLSLYILSNQLF